MRSGASLITGCAVILAFSGAAFSRNGVWRSELSLWQDVAAKNPSNARPHYLLGEYYLSKGDPDKAAEHYKIAAIRRPDSPETYNKMGIAYSERGLHDAAIEYFRKAAGLRPDYLPARFNLALCLLSKGDAEGARRELEEIIKIDPGHAEAARFLKHIKNQKKP